jgi:enoyl-CoA hydratase/carnithine racemase
MSYNTILYETDERVAIITLNRPKRLNALSLELCGEVEDAVRRADKDPDIRVLVITGAGGRAFSAGYDIKDDDEAMKDSVEEWWENLNEDYDFTFSVWNCSKPVIAMIEGYCLAGGLEFAQMCDIRYAADDARFGVVETRFSTGVVTMVMPWLIGPRCRELIYTGDRIDAEEAFRLGLVNRVFPKKDLRAEVMKIAKRMSQVSLACLKFNKRSVHHAYESMGFHGAMRYGVAISTLLDSTKTPELQKFDSIRRQDGLKAAIKWRDEQFARYE